MSGKKKKVVIAAGGTGGHLFPAQALAGELAKENVSVLFMGAGLDTNRYFDRDKYTYCDIPSATPFRRNPLNLFSFFFQVLKGIRHSLRLLRKEEPDLIVGFGSFHSFPILLAARLQRRALALFESNAYPGKVNRLFSSSASYTAIVLPKAQDHLKGKTIEVAMPVREAAEKLSLETARGYFGLDPRYPTLLLFGGSQGASAINTLFSQSVGLLQSRYLDFQVIHITGQAASVDVFKQAYATFKVKACVKAFETQMPIAYQAASLAICRAGAATISELIAFELPSILIPYPYATDDHQSKNAQFVQKEVKGGVCLAEKELTKEKLTMEIGRFLDPAQSIMQQMKESLIAYNLRQDRRPLWKLIYETIHPK